jgi:hypothetical protein
MRNPSKAKRGALQPLMFDLQHAASQLLSTIEALFFSAPPP